MSEILIKNMEMPTDEDEALVLVLYENGRVRKALDYNIIALSKETTTAQELQPHGRLGDLDSIESKLQGKIDDVPKAKDGTRITTQAFYVNGLLRAKELVGNSPTIIEASKERE